MSTASVSGTSRPPANPPARAPSAAPSAEDAQAMRDALAAARQQSEPKAGQPPLARQEAKPLATATHGKPVPAKPMPGRNDEAAAFGQAVQHQARQGTDPLAADRESAHDRGTHGDGVGLGQQGTVPIATVQAPPVPAPHVDASAFAQLMTRLWNRESAKGTREVRVEFGQATWPATGALLVRNAAGTLDIQLLTAHREALDGSVDALRQNFADNGIEVGALEVREG